jgi:hypothetical protein
MQTDVLSNHSDLAVIGWSGVQCCLRSDSLLHKCEVVPDGNDSLEDGTLRYALSSLQSICCVKEFSGYNISLLIMPPVEG